MTLDPKQLICELGREFYTLGWVSGTGGGISIKDGDQVYIAPSGVQKERITPDQIFTLNKNREIISMPNSSLKLSACAPIFFEIYDNTEANAVIHSHSTNASRISLAFDERFKITGIEMQKGIQGHDVFDLLQVPIIENVSHEKDLANTIKDTIKRNPKTQAVLVRGHGVYVWGKSWEHAKTQAECYDYLFKISLEETRIDLSKPIRRYAKAYHLDTATAIDEQTLREHGINYAHLSTQNPIGHHMRAKFADGEQSGYVKSDEVSINANIPFSELKRSKLEEKLFAFEQEHKHADDEVRHVTSGEGIFDIRDKQDHWIRIEVEQGDYLSIPENRYHRFFLTQEKKINATRLFKTEQGWTPQYRSAQK